MNVVSEVLVGLLFFFVFFGWVVEVWLGFGVGVDHAAVGFVDNIFDEGESEAAVDFVVELEGWAVWGVEEFLDWAEADLLLVGWEGGGPDVLADFEVVWWWCWCCDDGCFG